MDFILDLLSRWQYEPWGPIAMFVCLFHVGFIIACIVLMRDNGRGSRNYKTYGRFALVGMVTLPVSILYWPLTIGVLGLGVLYLVGRGIVWLVKESW